MAANVRIDDILELGVDERLRIVELIWDSLIARPASVGVTAAQQAALDERLADHAANPDDVIGWDELEATLRFR